MFDKTQFSMAFGRGFLASVFIFAAFSHLTDIEGTLYMMEQKGMPVAPLFLLGAVFLTLTGGFSFLLGYKTPIGVTLLILFIVPTTLIFHDFWNLEGPERTSQMHLFMKNIAILGGILYVSAFGPGDLSLDSSKTDEQQDSEQLTS